VKRETGNLVREALYGVMPVLELRGNDELARVGGDLDFMVPPGKAVAACAAMAQAARVHGWRVVAFRNIGYLAQVVLADTRGGTTSAAIKLDFFDGLRWYGIGRDVAAEHLFSWLGEHPDDALRLAGAAGFFQKILIVGQLATRDLARVSATGADAAFIARLAAQIALPIDEADVGAGGVTGLAKWRLRAATCGVAGVFAIAPWFARAAWAHLRFKLGVGTHAGMVIAVSGMDGSGKSTVVQHLLEAFSSAGGPQPRVVHLLPAWIPMPHQLLRRKRTVASYTQPYAEPPVASSLGAKARLLYYVAAFTLARLSVSVAAWRGRMVVMDRSAIDFLADPSRARIPVAKLPDWLKRWLAPPELLAYLDVTPEIAVARKNELSLIKAQALRAAYLELCNVLDVRRINADTAPDAVFAELLAHIGAVCTRNIARAGAAT
jgi:thymidylate kinase